MTHNSLVVAWQLLQNGTWRSWRRREWFAAAATALLSAAALGSFAAVAPSLDAFALDNPVSWDATPWRNRIGLLALGGAVMFVFAWVRSWIDVRWPSMEPTKTAVADSARLVFVLAASATVFRNPLVPSWLWLLP